MTFSDAPLMVIDPVDANRNVAAAVSTEKLGELISSSRIFLKKPNISFFFPSEPKPLSPSQLKEKLQNLGFDLILLIFEKSEVVSDVLWGQLYKSLRSIRSLLIHNDLRVLRASAWSNEKNVHVLLIGLESRFLATTKRHVGPPFDSNEVDHFLKKHVNAETTIFGPWIEGNRWIVGVKRRYKDSVSLLKDKLHDGGRSIGIPRGFTGSIQTSLQIQVNDEIMSFYSSNKAFAKYLTLFISGKPKWLK
jgi:tRNA nucleotidyltransferase (CCA-adding enzyme)